MATINVDGSKLPCFMIAHGKSDEDEEDQFGENVDEKNSSHSAKSYMTTEVFIKFLNLVREQFPENQRIHLIVDSYSSHTSKLSKQKAQELNINLLFISNGLTDELQPLDYGVFSILKNIANSKLRIFMRIHLGQTIGIEQSVQFLIDSWNQLSENTILEAWEAY